MQKKSPYQNIHQNIQKWYQAHGRVTLPWRNTKNPYKIYLSEIMLQQTQVKTVLERFYFPFLERFPTLKSVADAPVDDVLKAWEGLGYYTRARNLHKTAQATQGVLPATAHELEQLAGIGRSTAHAVACFAFGEAVPILDANVKRILYRFYAIKKCSDKELWEHAYRLFDAQNAYIYNQTMMDIGATLCTHKNPDCASCPFNSHCQGQDDPLIYPQKKSKKSKPTRQRYLIIHHQKDRYALTQNSTRLLGGLWGFVQKEHHTLSPQDTLLGTFSHHYTHFRLDATVILSQTQADLSYFGIEQIHELALSGADRKALALLEAYLA